MGLALRYALIDVAVVMSLLALAVLLWGGLRRIWRRVHEPPRWPTEPGPKACGFRHWGPCNLYCGEK